jgi:hypothetical protein
VTYPRLVAGLAFIPVPDGYRVVGGPRLQALTGAVARDLLPWLLPLLDGVHDEVVIAAELGIAPATLHVVIGTLARRGLVCTAPAPLPAGTLLERSLGPGRAAAVAARLATMHVAVCCTGIFAATITDIFERAGIRTGSACEGAALAIVEGSGNPPSEMPWLPVYAAADGVVTVGPLVGMLGVACRSCAAPGGQGIEDPALAAIAAGIAVGSVVRFLGGYGRPAAWNRVVKVSTDGRVQERPVYGQPGCAVCSRPELMLTEAALEQFRYELGIDLPAACGDRNPRTLGPLPTAPPKRYLNEPRHRPQGTLRWLLRVTGPEWTPSAGGPCTVNRYVLGNLPGAGRSVCAVDDAGSGDLVVIKPAPRGGLRFVFCGDLVGSTAAFGQSGRRLAYQDSGLALAQIAVGADAAGWRARVRAEDPAGLLDLDPAREIPAAVVELISGAAGGADRRRRLSQLLTSLPACYEFSDASVEIAPLTELVARALAGTRALWGRDSPPVRCLVLACRVDGLAAGLHNGRFGWLKHVDPGPVLSYLADRNIEPAALLLFTGDVAAALASCGPDGYRVLVAKAATAAGGVRIAAGRAGLAAGLFARLPGSLVQDRNRRVLYGCALGAPARHAGPDRLVAW